MKPFQEKDSFRKKLIDTEGELSKRANDKAMERIMREKDQQIAELLEEGKDNHLLPFAVDFGDLWWEKSISHGKPYKMHIFWMSKLHIILL